MEFALYFLVPGNDDEGWNDEQLLELVKTFDVPQRALIANFLFAVLQEKSLGLDPAYPKHGLKYW